MGASRRSIRSSGQRLAAHPDRIGDVGTSFTATTSASALSGRISRALPWRTTRLAISHWSPPPGTATSGTPASSVLATIPCPPPQTTTSACRINSA